MKFPRHARLLRSQLDAAPLASVFFLLVIFVMLGSHVYVPGVHVQLPAANNLPGTDRPTVTVALDASNRLFFKDRLITEADLSARLREAVKNSREPLTLVVQAASAVTYENLVRLDLLARDAGFRDALHAVTPRQVTTPGKP
jgi:biopolymer transport protein ExbD